MIATTYKPAHPTAQLLARRLANGKYRYDEHGQLERRCSCCKEYWPADTQFFTVHKDGDGLHSTCKACRADTRHALESSRRQTSSQRMNERRAA